MPPSPRLFRAAQAAVLDAIARRTAPPVVTAVRDAGRTSLPAAVLADLHALVLDAERAGIEGAVVVAGDARGGTAVVVADGRLSAREVRVYGVADPAALTAALAAHGFPPASTRIALLNGLPDADGPTVAVAYLGRSAASALGPVATRLAAGGVAVVAAATAAERAHALSIADAHGLAVDRKPRRMTLRRAA